MYDVPDKERRICSGGNLSTNSASCSSEAARHRFMALSHAMTIARPVRSAAPRWAGTETFSPGMWMVASAATCHAISAADTEVVSDTSASLLPEVKHRIAATTRSFMCVQLRRGDTCQATEFDETFRRSGDESQ